MKTDDFLADFETQLREAQREPVRRRIVLPSWPPLAGLVVAAAAALVLIVGLGGRADDEERAVTAPGNLLVAVRDASGYPPLADRVADELLQGGYGVEAGGRPVANRETTRLVAGPGHAGDAERIAAFLGVPDPDVETHPLASADVLVLAGEDILGTPDGAGLDRVAVFDQSGRPGQDRAVQGRLEDAGIELEAVGSAGIRGGRDRTVVIARDGSDADLLAEVRAAVGFPPGPPVLATRAQLRSPYFAGARVLVLVGRDYPPPGPGIRVLITSAGPARAAVRAVEEGGYQVRTEPRIEQPFPRTQLEYTAGNAAAARDVAALLGVPDARRVKVFGDVGPIDVNVYVGRDIGS